MAEHVFDDIPPYRYTAALAGEIEAKWQDRWDKEGTFHTPNPVGPLSDGYEKVAGRPKLFVMDMFPYPSGSGLHVGHPLGYIGTDVYTRFKRMTGYNVLYTMGFDAFGLPAEQHAVSTGVHPRVNTESNVANMRRQLRRLGLGHDPRRSISTTDVAFYRWTQWIFLQVFNSWYDTTANGGQGRARRISELIAEFESGERTPADGRSWASLSARERRSLIDDHRLAHVADAPVNWCPGLGTVVANEEVTADGRSDRGNFPVFKRNMRQWMMRITTYADRLLEDLDVVDWPEPVKIMQRNWIGRSHGARVTFASPAGEIDVFTTRPDTLFGATYMVLAPEHPLVAPLTTGAWPAEVDPRWTAGKSSPAEAIAAYQEAAKVKTDMARQDAGREKTGVFTGSYAVNPVNGAHVPVFIADYVMMGYGTGAIMAVPSGDQRDFEFATTFGLPVVATVQPPEAWLSAAGVDAQTLADQWPRAYDGDGDIVNSRNDSLNLNGTTIDDAKIAITAWLADRNAGHGTTQYKLRDWLFSRQRYWGEPFPIVYDETGMPIALPDELLPVELPDTDQFSPRTFDPDDEASNPEAPLDRLTDWIEVTLDLGDGPKKYRRDNNVMPQWAGSCWYYLGYIDPTTSPGQTTPADLTNERYWMGEGPSGGVDLYVGGVEHAVLHLLYSRFWHKVLFDLGHVSTPEPFHRLFNQGYILAAAFKDEREIYVDAEAVQELDGQYLYEGKPVTREWGKMGKSLKNAVTPDDMYEQYGADTLRLYEMAMGPLELSRPWETRAVSGAHRLLQRVWRSLVDEGTGALRVSDEAVPDETLRVLHRTIAAVREAMGALRINTPIAKITELNNHLTQAYPGGAPRVVAEPLVLLLAPYAPHVAEELWQRLGNTESLTWVPFPEADPTYLVDDTVEVPVQVNGKVRSKVVVAADADEAALESAARNDEKVAAQLEGKTVRKVIAVPGRMINFVVG